MEKSTIKYLKLTTEVKNVPPVRQIIAQRALQGEEPDMDVVDPNLYLLYNRVELREATALEKILRRPGRATIELLLEGEPDKIAALEKDVTSFVEIEEARPVANAMLFVEAYGISLIESNRIVERYWALSESGDYDFSTDIPEIRDGKERLRLTIEGPVRGVLNEAAFVSGYLGNRVSLHLEFSHVETPKAKVVDLYSVRDVVRRRRELRIVDDNYSGEAKK